MSFFKDLQKIQRYFGESLTKAESDESEDPLGSAIDALLKRGEFSNLYGLTDPTNENDLEPHHLEKIGDAALASNDSLALDVLENVLKHHNMTPEILQNFIRNVPEETGLILESPHVNSDVLKTAAQAAIQHKGGRIVDTEYSKLTTQIPKHPQATAESVEPLLNHAIDKLDQHTLADLTSPHNHYQLSPDQMDRMVNAISDEEYSQWPPVGSESTKRLLDNLKNTQNLSDEHISQMLNSDKKYFNQLFVNKMSDVLKEHHVNNALRKIHDLPKPMSNSLLEHPKVDPKILQDIWQKHGLGSKETELAWMDSILQNPNTPYNILRDATKSPSLYKIMAQNPNLPPDIIKTIAPHEGMDQDYIIDLLSHKNAPEDLVHLWEQNNKDKVVHTTPNSHKLRKLRDFIEEQGGSAAKKQIEKAGFNVDSLGLKHAVSGSGKLSSHAVQQHIDKSPKLKYTHSHDTYGERDINNLDWSDLDVEAYEAALRHEASGVDTERLLDDEFTLNDLPNALQSDYIEFFKNRYGDDAEVDDDALSEFLNEQLNAENQHKNTDARLFLNRLEDEISEKKGEIALENIRDPADYYSDVMEVQEALHNASTSEDEYSEVITPSVQRHTPEESQVFQLNLHPSQIKQMKDEGVYDTYTELADESRMSGHPIGENGIGWVRYTKDDDNGHHIDEVQSDFGQNFIKHLKKFKQQAEAGNEKAQEVVNRFPENHMNRINDIIFGGHNPSQILTDSFHQYLRNTGQHDAEIHIWDSKPKAEISLSDPDEGIPVHMKETYSKNPKKMGYQKSQYGNLATQHNPLLQGKQTWSDKVRKSLKNDSLIKILKNMRQELMENNPNEKWLLIYRPESHSSEYYNLFNDDERYSLHSRYNIFNENELFDFLKSEPGIYAGLYPSKEKMRRALSRMKRQYKLPHARQWAQENGHHDGDMLFRMLERFEK